MTTIQYAERVKLKKEKLVQVIEPFKRVVSHGGYEAGAGGASGAALIVFSACHLPDNARADYRYVMDNLFL